MHVEVSNVFGTLKDHPVASVERVDNEAMPGVIDMRHDPDDAILVEIDGQELAQWLPWHFDHCYNNELNRAGVLRAIDIPPQGGMTGFLDGVDLYDAFAPDLREEIERETIIYRLNVVYAEWRFGRPAGFRPLHTPKVAYEVNANARNLPRALHPAVWTRDDGRKVMHVSPWMAEGVEGRETAEGAETFEAVCQEIATKAKGRAYFHSWSSADMLIWDNWRMLHCVTGASPNYARRMHRTTIEGDYGLGRFEGGARGSTLLKDTMV
jgi:taurine dioxygenase